MTRRPSDITAVCQTLFAVPPVCITFAPTGSHDRTADSEKPYAKRVGTNRKKQTTTMKTVSDNSAGKEVITTLQQMLIRHGFALAADGVFGNGTRQAVMEFQHRHGLTADGIAGYRTWEALFFADRGDGMKLTEKDLELTARLLDVEPAALKAVKAVESGKYGGFFAPGKPVILFEGHIFWQQLKKRGISPERHTAGNKTQIQALERQLS